MQKQAKASKSTQKHTKAHKTIQMAGQKGKKQ
jgi:hypothetical protein